MRGRAYLRDSAPNVTRPACSCGEEHLVLATDLSTALGTVGRHRAQSERLIRLTSMGLRRDGRAQRSQRTPTSKLQLGTLVSLPIPPMPGRSHNPNPELSILPTSAPKLIPRWSEPTESTITVVPSSVQTAFSHAVI